MLRVRAPQHLRQQPLPGHPQQYPRRGGDAGERTGEHAHKRADIDHRRQPGQPGQRRQHMQGGGARAQVLVDAREAQHLDIGA